MTELPKAVETLKTKFLQNLDVIDRLIDEKHGLEKKVEDLASKLKERKRFQPWWEYGDSPRSPRSARVARKYGEIQHDSPRGRSSSARGNLLSASAAAKLFETPSITPKSGSCPVGLSRHLMADTDKYKQKLAFITDKEKLEKLEEQRHLNALEEKKRSALEQNKGPFKGLEHRYKTSKKRNDARAAEKLREEEAVERAKNDERRKAHLEHVHTPLGPAIGWDMIQANEEITRRERIESRKLKLLAASVAPAAAQPFPPRAAPAPFPTRFIANDPKKVAADLQKQAERQKSNDEKAKQLELAKTSAEIAELEMLAASKEGQAALSKSTAQARRLERLQTLELKKLKQQKSDLADKIRRILSLSSDPDASKNLTSRSTSAPGRSRRLGEDEDERSSKERHSKECDDIPDWEYDRKERSEKESAEKEFSDKARYEKGKRDNDRGRGGLPQVPKKRHITLIERHEMESLKQRAADVALGIRKKPL